MQRVEGGDSSPSDSGSNIAADARLDGAATPEGPQWRSPPHSESAVSEKPRRWPQHVAKHLQTFVVDADESLDAARLRFRQRFDTGRPRYIAAYRAHADATAVELGGRVLASHPDTSGQEDDGWWDNLLDTYRRFESDELADVELTLRFRGVEVTTRSDAEGYYQVRIETPAAAASDELWENAVVALADGSLQTPQPVLQIGPRAGIGVISDIDDTILFSSILEWKTAAQLAFLHNARTRKPLQGVAKLYQALQHGPAGDGRNPVFYVSSSPWNLYDLLEDFIELNAIPAGPVFLRDIGFDPGKFVKSPGHGHKLERARELIARYPTLRWVLVGDSGQEDAELYAQAAREFGARIAAIYIRDVDPAGDDPRDAFVDGHIEKVAGTKVPMLRARDSLAIAEHAFGLGLIAEDTLDGIAKEVQRDRTRPSLPEAVKEKAKDVVADAAESVSETAKDVVAEVAEKITDAPAKPAKPG
jgi:phosphatidate phosphatase APP1